MIVWGNVLTWKCTSAQTVTPLSVIAGEDCEILICRLVHQSVVVILNELLPDKHHHIIIIILQPQSLIYPHIYVLSSCSYCRPLMIKKKQPKKNLIIHVKLLFTGTRHVSRYVNNSVVVRWVRTKLMTLLSTLLMAQHLAFWVRWWIVAPNSQAAPKSVD